MISPPSLQKGDKIAIVGTARKIPREEVEPAIKILESWGLEVVLGKHLFEVDHQFAGTDEQRLTDFQRAIDAPEIKAVLCVRGGYGTVRIIDQIDFSAFAKSPKWIAGYSDITVLHNHLFTNLQTETLHATMPINFPKNSNEALTSLQKALFGNPLSYAVDGHHLNRNGEGEGEVVGGNLSIVFSLTGTNSDIDTNGKILFIEDLDEYLYHVDRMLWNLDKCGMLKNLAGLIVGGMTGMNDNAVAFGKTAEEIILERVVLYNFPVCFNFPAGHIDDNRTLIIGRKAKLTVDNTVNLTFQ
jgi:muramoyltetrapeptide carboxypeptidase